MAEFLRGVGLFIFIVLMIGVVLPLGATWAGYGLFKLGGVFVGWFEVLMPLFPPHPDKWV